MNETYVPLYRKYRPQTLGQVVGQEHVKKALSSAIELNKIAHAFLFTGPRGTGKTSTARILAKSLNCKNGPTIEPCGECASCRDVINSVPIDVIEIDAASNRKVEDAQNILEKIQYVPVNGKYKIYIIDEVHMLTNHAFNALLKTLEEPPENVVFILATTEVHKVLDTIKSRCQRYDFKRITTSDIAKHLRFIADEEQIKIDDEALLTIAKNSAGGMRDSISLLDQLSVLGAQETITTEDINRLLGRISFDKLNNLAEEIINSQPQTTIKIVEQIYNSGNEPSQILTNLLDYFKNLLIVKNCQEEITFELTQANENQVKDMKLQAQKIETQQIVFLIERITHYIREVKATNNQHLWLEVAIIDLANLTENSSLIELQKRLSALESGQSLAPAKPQISIPQPRQTVVTNQKEETKVETKTTTPKEVNATAEKVSTATDAGDFSPMPKSQPTPTNDLANLWAMLLTNIPSPSTQAMLKLASPVEISPDRVVLTFKNEIFVKQANDEAKKQPIIEAANILFNQENSNVIIRLPQKDDVVVEKKKSN